MEAVYPNGTQIKINGSDYNPLNASRLLVVEDGYLVKNETIAGLKKHGVKMTEQQFGEVWRAYENLKELSPEVANRGLKYGILKDIADIVTDTNKSADEIATALNKDLSRIYEQQAGLENGVDGVSGFFEIE